MVESEPFHSVIIALGEKMMRELNLKSQPFNFICSLSLPAIHPSHLTL